MTTSHHAPVRRTAAASGWLQTLRSWRVEQYTRGRQCLTITYGPKRGDVTVATIELDRDEHLLMPASERPPARKLTGAGLLQQVLTVLTAPGN